MKIIADLCIAPMSVGPSVSAYIREIRTIIEASGLVHVMHANNTNIEGEMAEASSLVEACCARLTELGVERVFCAMIFPPAPTNLRAWPTSSHGSTTRVSQ
ncbi:MAG: thiamine-binding protein [Candidatus Devosia euplotis]|nr:thiamine-binding protein [Candidatus Devosia euplotis]